MTKPHSKYHRTLDTFCRPLGWPLLVIPSIVDMEILGSTDEDRTANKSSTLPPFPSDLDQCCPLEWHLDKVSGSALKNLGSMHDYSLAKRAILALLVHLVPILPTTCLLKGS